MSAPEVDELRSFFPVDATIRDGKPQIEWLKMPEATFREAFFHQTVERAREGNRSLFTDLELLLQTAKVDPSRAPSGFIFHSSRCGSTLVANACKALDSSRVIAEAPVIDKLISRLLTDAEPGTNKELIYLSLVRAAVQLLARDTSGAVGRYFVKFACTSLLHVKALRRTWPNVPFLILFRNPIEVTVSNLRDRPEWMSVDSNPAAAAAIVGVDVKQLVGMTNEEFCARALGRFYAAAERISSDHLTRLVDYSQLSLETITSILQFFGARPSTAEIAAIERSLLSHSKDPARAFRPDSADKQSAAASTVIEAVEMWSMPSYERVLSKLVLR